MRLGKIFACILVPAFFCMVSWNHASLATREALIQAGRKAVSDGIAGAIAGSLEVPLFMWLRTVMNYQFRHGTAFFATLQNLYAEGGVGRLYNGLMLTLLMTSLSRFGEMGANAGAVALMGNTVPPSVVTMIASMSSVGFRVLITPLDTLKTTMQVEGRRAIGLLQRKVASGGGSVLYHGVLAASIANFVGTYPWFWAFNFMDRTLPYAASDAVLLGLLRSALLGLSAACASDCCSNVFRVLKAVRQTCAEPMSYTEAARLVIATDGVRGLFGRGLRTRLFINGLQSSLFGVFWKALQARWA